MRMALWQTCGLPGNVTGNLDQLERQATAAAQGGAQLLLCPELWLGGYNLPQRMAELAEPADGPSAQRIAALARRLRIAIAYGYAERHPEGGKPFNSVQVIGAKGERLGGYRKTHLFGAMEHQVFSPGECLEPPFSYAGWRIALLVCFDVEYPEAVRTHALAGAELLLIPTALTPEYAGVPGLIVPARALENQMFVAYCNHCGVEEGLAFLGGSCIVGPDGERLAAAGAGESLLLVDLDPQRRQALADTFPYLPGRRPELYAALTRTDG
ncbi:MAG: (R)-stereoselective amidase [Stenotrophomonas maltophilia]|nr:MAG: (R)-stereoselective amidase [Stenotrophomonas maltophilia]